MPGSTTVDFTAADQMFFLSKRFECPLDADEGYSYTNANRERARQALAEGVFSEGKKELIRALEYLEEEFKKEARGNIQRTPEEFEQLTDAFHLFWQSKRLCEHVATLLVSTIARR